MAVTDVPASAVTDESGANQVHEIVSLIGPKLHALRTAQRHSLQQLAVLSDVSAAAIHKIERNGMVPTITTLLKLGAALGVPVSYFVEEDEQPPEPVHYTPADRRPSVYTPHQGLALAGITGSYGSSRPPRRSRPWLRGRRAATSRWSTRARNWSMCSRGCSRSGSATTRTAWTRATRCTSAARFRITGRTRPTAPRGRSGSRCATGRPYPPGRT